METAPFVDINIESIKDKEKQLWEIGDQCERKIVNGESVLINEEDRIRLKELLSKSGVDFEKISGKINPLYWKPPEYFGNQSEGLMEALGKDRLMNFVQKSILELTKSKGGAVIKGSDSHKYIDQTNDLMISDFIRGFLAMGQKANESWKENTVWRIEALLSATDKLLWIIGANDEEEAKRRQNTEGVKKHLRERVIRGCERAGETVPAETDRIEKDKIIRHLPKRGIAVILEQLSVV